MIFILWILHNLIEIYIFIVVIACVISFLPLNLSNNYVRKITYFIYQITQPAFDFVRKIIPTTAGGIDFAPLVILIGLQFADYGIRILARWLM